MIRLAIYLLLLAVSVWLGLKISASPGYVLINYQHWVIETSIWIALGVLILTFAIGYFLVRFLVGVMSIQARLARWRSARRHRRAQKLTQKGLKNLAEGNWRSAEKALVKGADRSDTPLINYLAAANAAQGEGNLDARDEYLQKALYSTENAEVAVGLTQAQLQMDNEQLEQSLATLEHLHRMSPDNKQVMNLLQRVYVRLEDWDGVRELLPQLRKYKVCDQDELLDLESKANRALFEMSLGRASAEDATKLWKKLPKHVQADPQMIVVYSNSLMAHGDQKHAEKLLHHAINDNWHPLLIRQYAKVQSPKPAKQLATAEGWLSRYPEDVHLMITIGELCLQNKLWGKAQRFFETALVKETSVEILNDLGQVYEQLGYQDKAISCFKRGLALAVSSA